MSSREAFNLRWTKALSNLKLVPEGMDGSESGFASSKSRKRCMDA